VRDGGLCLLLAAEGDVGERNEVVHMAEFAFAAVAERKKAGALVASFGRVRGDAQRALGTVSLLFSGATGHGPAQVNQLGGA